MNRLQRLRQRKIVQWVIAYCAAAWAILEVLAFLTGEFAWPAFIVRSLTVILAVGIIVVFVVAWFHGEKGAQRVSVTEVAVLGALLLVAAVGAVSVGRGDRRPQKPAADEDGNVQGSVAVLPFRNLSGDSSQKFFSDGFTEELSNALASVEGLRVLAPSAFTFAGAEENVRELARDFNAQSTLEGSVRRAGDQVRVTARLVNTHSNRQLWSATYDKTLSPANILAVQEEIARAIARALELALVPARVSAGMASGGTNSQEAYDAYLRGLGALARVTRESYAVASREFERALAIDSMFARAHAGLAFALGGYWMPRPDDPNREKILKRAEREARRALQLDSTLVDAHVVLHKPAFTPDPARRRAHLDAAIRKDPAARWPRLFSAYLWLESFERARAVAEMDDLLARDPYSPWSYIMAGNIRNLAGQYARADSALDRAEQLAAMGFGPYPEWPLYWNRAYTAIMWRQYDRAGFAFARAYDPEFAVMARASARALREIAGIMRSPQDSAQRYRAAVRAVLANEDSMQEQMAAMMYLQLGDTARLYDLMERKPGRIFLRTPIYDRIRNTPRFVELSMQAR